MQSKEIMFHHRYPTSTDNSVKHNHPIYNVKDYDHNYYLVHNGVIQNDVELKKYHEELGLTYTSAHGTDYNDSECLLNELAMVIEGIKKPQEFTAKGSMAFVLLQTDKMGHAKGLYYGRNWGSPLKIHYDKEKYLMLSSAGAGGDVELNKLFQYHYDKKHISWIDMIMPTGATQTYNGYQSTPAWDDIDRYNKNHLDAKTNMLLGTDDIPRVYGAPLSLPMSTDNKFIILTYEKLKDMALTRHELEELDLQCIKVPDLHKLMMELQTERDKIRAQKYVAMEKGRLALAETFASDIELLNKNIGHIIDVLSMYKQDRDIINA